MGRKRLFDIDEALEIAMRQFWLKGYEGTTLADLTRAIGIEKPSLYWAFSSKEELFRRALERYEQQHLQFVQRALARPSIKDAIRQFLRGFIKVIANPELPRGCLSLNAVIACAPENEAIRQELVVWRAGYEKLLQQRFAKAIEQGELSPDIAPLARAGFMISICAGLALQAKSGASRVALFDISEVALACVL